MRMSVSTEEVSGGGPGGQVGGSGGGTGNGSNTSSSSRSGSLTVTVQQSTMVPITTTTDSQQSDVVKTAYRRKLKGKKKFFVLRRETENGGPARLEYHANERKFKLGHTPKKSIILKACFNISRTDAKCKWAVALHTHNDCVRIAMNSEEEMTEWLRLMNSLTGDEDESEDMMPFTTMTTSVSTGTTISPTTMSLMGGVKPHFEHVWLVTALNKGLGSKENILGPYRLCLTSKELTLLKVGDHDEKNAVLKFPLNVIRNVAHDATFGCFFHIEFGRLAPTGPGQLSLKTEDNNIAQNMHLLILKAMQNYSKDDLIPREGTRRGRTNTWNSESMMRPGSYYSGTPPVITRINSMDSSMRIRTESMGSSESRGGGSGHGMSPPMPIHTPPPSISFSSPMCSTTDSASSSYSVDYENNNGQQTRLSSSLLESSCLYSKSHEDESYVPWNPTAGDEPSLTMSPSLSLPLSSFDTTDYVETNIGHRRSADTHSTTPTTGSAAATPSSYMEMQSPVSPYDNYMSMSPGTGISGTSGKSAGKAASSSHSRNSSLIEEHEGYVPMHPGAQYSQCGSGAGSTAGSTAGLDESYLDMDFGRKLNLSNDDVRRMSPASSESLQSGTPSSDYPLEKVSSYLLPSDDLDDSSGPRPLRAYSVGSKSDTSATGKGRYGKNRLEAVQETFRLRALSVGARNPRAARTSVNHFALPTSNSGLPGNGSHYNHTSTGVFSVTPLSSSWSGSTGRWPALKFFTQNQTSPSSASHSHQNSNSDTVDSDLMELDFSHNKKVRKRSLPGPGTIGTLSASSIGSSQSSGSKISPCQKGIVETPETPTDSKSIFSSSSYGNYMTPTLSGSENSKHASSAPISIQKAGCGKNVDGGFVNSSDSGISILTRMTGLDLKQIKQLDDDGAYLDMNFGGTNTSVINKSRFGNNGGGNGKRSSANNLPIIPRSNSMGNPIISKPVLPAVVVKASENVVSAPFNLDKTTSSFNLVNPNVLMNCDKSNMIPSNLSVLNIPSTSTSVSSTASSPSLSRIEESPEKQDPATTTTTRTSSPQSPDPAVISPGLLAVTYASIEHLPNPEKHGASPDSIGQIGVRTPTSADIVMYSQIDFVKTLEGTKSTN